MIFFGLWLKIWFFFLQQIYERSTLTAPRVFYFIFFTYWPISADMVLIIIIIQAAGLRHTQVTFITNSDSVWIKMKKETNGTILAGGAIHCCHHQWGRGEYKMGLGFSLQHVPQPWGWFTSSACAVKPLFWCSPGCSLRRYVM